MTMRGIDTLAIARKLEAAGVDRGQAEAHAEAINESVVIRYSELATKADLERFPTRENPEPFTTRDDLLQFATKEDLKRFATKEDLRHFATKKDLERFATKEDLERLTLTFATKEDLENYPTRDEMQAALDRLEKRMMAMWAASTVSLASLIIAMPFVTG